MQSQLFETMPVQHIINAIRSGKTQLLATGEMKAATQSSGVDETAPLDGQKQVVLVIQDTPTRLLLVQHTEVVLGRVDTRSNYYPDLDLAPYGGTEMGVSRTHASLVYKNRTLYITDLGSSNGTYVNGTRLNAHEPQPLLIGEIIALGRLIIHIESPKVLR